MQAVGKREPEELVGATAAEQAAAAQQAAAARVAAVEAQQAQMTAMQQKQQQELEAAKDRAARWKAYGEAIGQFHRMVDGLTELPTLQEPAEVQRVRPGMTMLNSCLQTWVQAGAQYPFTLADLPAVEDGFATPQDVLKEVLNDKWIQFFP